MNLSNLINSSFLSKKAMHFYVILACILMQMFNWGEPYRLFANLNMLIVLVVLALQYSQFEFAQMKRLVLVSIILLGFIAIHLIVAEHWVFTREMRRVILAVFLMIGIWLQVKDNGPFVRQHLFKFSLWMLSIYVIAQAVSLWILGRPDGTANNPHYLAFYSAASLMVGLYAFFNMTKPIKWLLVVPVLLLGVFLVKTGSRPTWIGLILAGMLVVTYLEPRIKKWAIIAMASVLAILTFTNIGNFESRSADLILHLNTEERVTIWQDVWRMQNDSALAQWIFGHGLDVFKSHFKAYSHYHLQQIDFNSPHNFILELLYTTGAIGLALAIALIVLMYRYLLLAIKFNPQDKALILLLMAVFTTMLITVSITVPYFSGYNLNTMAVVFGVLLSIYNPNVSKLT
jgi:O-antigen ligase